MQTTLIPLDQIAFSEKNQRSVSPDKIGELAKEIDSVGLIHPVTVRPHPVISGMYEMIAGENRTKAYRVLHSQNPDKYSEIPANVKQDCTDAEAALIRYIENSGRQDLSPLEESDLLNDLLGEYGAINAMSEAIGKPSSYIAGRLKLRDMIPEGTKMLKDGSLPVSHALEICRFTPDDQKKMLAYMKDEGFKGVKSLSRLKAFIKENILLNLSTATFDVADATLFPKAGACIACPKHTGANKALFADISGKDDRCTDLKCFEQKKFLQLFKDIQDAIKVQPDILLVKMGMVDPVAELEKLINKHKYPVVSHLDGYEICLEDDDGARHGLIINPPNAGERIILRKIIVGKKPKKTKSDSNGKPQPSPEDIEATIAELESKKELAYHSRDERYQEALIREYSELSKVWDGYTFFTNMEEEVALYFFIWGSLSISARKELGTRFNIPEVENTESLFEVFQGVNKKVFMVMFRTLMVEQFHKSAPGTTGSFFLQKMMESRLSPKATIDILTPLDVETQEKIQTIENKIAKYKEKLQQPEETV